MSLAGSMIGGLFGIGSSILNNMYATQRTEEDRERNYYLNEQAAWNADRRTRALYEDFYAPKALVKQYMEAGLSPSMMFGGTPGQGGMSGAQGAGAGGLQTPYMPVSIVEAAQAAALTAQAEKTKAETKQIEPLAEADIAAKLAEAGYKKASTCYTESLTTGQEISNYIADKTSSFTIHEMEEKATYMMYQAKKAYFESISSDAQSIVDTKTIEAKVKEATEKYKNLIADSAEKWSKKHLNEQEILESQERINTLIQSVSIDWVKALTENKNAVTYEEWVNAKKPYLEKELELEAERIGVEKTKVWIDGVSRTIQGIGFTIMTASNVMNKNLQGETTGTFRLPNGQKIPTKHIAVPDYYKPGKRNYYGRYTRL